MRWWLLAVALALLVLQGRKSRRDRTKLEVALQETVEELSVPVTKALKATILDARRGLGSFLEGPTAGDGAPADTARGAQ